MKIYSVEEIRSILTPIAMQYGVRSVSLFGSYAKGTASDKSDVDLKIEKGKLKTLFELSGFRLAAQDALNLPVDLVTSESTDRAFLTDIGRDEVLLYRES